MTDSERINHLEAQNLAMVYVLRGIIPLIPFPRATMLALHTTSIDALNAHMERVSDDEEFQHMVRDRFEYLWLMLSPDHDIS